MSILKKIGLIGKPPQEAQMVINNATRKTYNKTRPSYSTKTFCQAPLNNMYFSWEGKVVACCFNQEYILGNYPEQTIRDIWFGEPAFQLRESLKNYNLSKGCDVCYKDIQSGRIDSANSLRFDEYVPEKYPTMLEFQISNTCNLECMMCDGFLSSAIRANREKLPAIPPKYDDEFARQLEEFLPHLKYTTFSGGEPFLIKTYYQIWNKLSELNKTCIVKVITNGTILNDRVKEVLAKNNFHITISLDSPHKDTYENIRKGANFDNVIENAKFFNEYCKQRGTQFNFNFCPMVNNWEEIPAFVELCNQMDASFHFSMVYHPLRYSLSALSPEKLKMIDLELQKISFAADNDRRKNNKMELNKLISLIRQFSKSNEGLAEAEHVNETDVIELLYRRMDQFDKEGKMANTEELRYKLQEAILLAAPYGINFPVLLKAVEEMTFENFVDNSRADVEHLKRILIQKYSI